MVGGSDSKFARYIVVVCRSMCVQEYAQYKAKHVEIRSLQQLKQAAGEVAGGFEDHESGQKWRGWDALAPHRQRGNKGHPSALIDGQSTGTGIVVVMIEESRCCEMRGQGWTSWSVWGVPIIPSWLGDLNLQSSIPPVFTKSKSTLTIVGRPQLH